MFETSSKLPPKKKDFEAYEKFSNQLSDATPEPHGPTLFH